MCQMIDVNTNFGSTVTVADIKKDSIENIITAAADCPKIDEIILFGSSLEERCREDSDIDIAIISNIPRSVLYRNQDNNAYVCQEILTKGKMIYKKV